MFFHTHPKSNIRLLPWGSNASSLAAANLSQAEWLLHVSAQYFLHFTATGRSIGHGSTGGHQSLSSCGVIAVVRSKIEGAPDARG